MSFWIGGGASGERLPQPPVVFLPRKSRHADTPDILVNEPFFYSPLGSSDLRSRIIFRWDAVQDDTAMYDATKPLHAGRHCCRDRDRRDSAAKGVPVNPSRARFNFALRQVEPGARWIHRYAF